MFSTVNNFLAFKPGSVNLTVELNTKLIHFKAQPVLIVLIFTFPALKRIQTCSLKLSAAKWIDVIGRHGALQI